MQTFIKTREIRLEETEKDLIFKKTSKIEKHFPDAHKLEIEIFQETNPSISNPTSVELTLSCKKHLMRASSNGSDLIATVDNAIHKINRQVEKYKDKMYHRAKKQPLNG